MEATIQSTNKAIIIDVNVSINVAALKATLQHGLQSIKQRVLLSIKQHCNVGAWSLPRLYRKELRMARAIARAIDAQPTLSNIALWLMGIALAFEVFMFA